MKSREVRLSLMLIGICLLAASAAWGGRTWSDATGKYSVEAELVEVKDGNVRLKRTDGKVVAIPLSQLSQADHDYLASLAGGPPAGEPAAAPMPPELKVLGLRVGTWEGRIQVKPASTSPETVELTFTEVVEWTLGGRFIQGKAVQNGKVEYFWLATYDPRAKVYRFWQFDSLGNLPTSATTGEWDESTRTLTWKSTVAEGVTSTQTIRFVDENTYALTGVDKGSDGKVYLELGGQAIRKK